MKIQVTPAGDVIVIIGSNVGMIFDANDWFTLLEVM